MLPCVLNVSALPLLSVIVFCSEVTALIVVDPLATVDAYLNNDEKVQSTLKLFGGTAAEVFGVKERHGRNVISFSLGRPLMHIDALERGDSFAWSNEKTVLEILDPHKPSAQAIIGPSGVGKSTTIYRALLREFGCYLDVAVSPNQGGQFMKALDRLLVSASKKADPSDYAVGLIQRAHLTLLLVLQRFKELVPQCTPKQWTYLMLSASSSKYLLHTDINLVLAFIFTTLKNIDDGVLLLKLADLQTKLECRMLYLDEAQVYLDTTKYGTFAGGTGTKFRSILSPLLTIKNVVVSGTGLNLQQVAAEAGSHIAKEQNTLASPCKPGVISPREARKTQQRVKARIQIVLTVPGCSQADVEAFIGLYGIPIPVGCTAEIKSLCGRARLVANFVRNMLLADRWDQATFKACAKRTLEEFTEALVANMTRHFSSNKQVETPGALPVGYRELACSLLNCAVFNDGTVEAGCDEIIDFINASMCMLEARDNTLVAYIRERASIDALFAVCRIWRIQPLMRQVIGHMHSVFTDAEGQGLDFEYLFIADVAMRALHPNATDEHRKTVFGNLATELPRGADLAWPSWSHVDRFELFDCRSTKSTLQQFLQEAVDGKFDHYQYPLFCLPETAAGPDVVGFLKAGNGQKVLWMTQCKRWSKNLGGQEYVKAVNTTLQTKIYHREGQKPKGWENKQNQTRSFCTTHFPRCLSVLCTVPTRTKGAITATLAIPKGTTFVFIDQTNLQQIMSTKGFNAAATGTREHQCTS